MKPIGETECTATLIDAGRAAGVSGTATSVVLNRGSSGWQASPETRRRTFASPNKVDYRPNAAAQAVANRRVQTLGIVTVVEGSELDDYFLEVFNGILAAATRFRQNTTVFTLPSWQGASEQLNDLSDGRVDGLVLVAPTLSGPDSPIPQHMPVVTVHANRELAGVTNIESDEECGACTLVSHLIAWRHRRILHLAGPGGATGARSRAKGYLRAFAEADLPVDPSLVVTAGYTKELGRRALQRWLRRHAGEPMPDAVFCANDAVAVGCLEVFAELGLRVPEDVSVAGFDDTYVARTIVPRLTTVRQPLRDMGERAVELLLHRIDGTPPSLTTHRRVVFPTEVVPRGSVGMRPMANRLIGPW